MAAKKKTHLVPTWTTACKDWTKRIAARKPLAPCPPLFQDEADLGLSYFDELYMVDLGRKDDGSFHTFGEVSPPWVRDFVGALFGCYCDIPDHPMRGRRLMKEFFMLISKKNSKALALDTPIPTPAGWTTMGEIQVGDTVYGADGKPCKVVATSPVYHDHDCYKIGFSNGESVVADAGHLWLTKALADKPGSGKGNGGDLSPRKLRVRTTEEIAKTLRRGYDNAANHSMPMPSAIEGCEITLPVSPYTLGAWLGDGHTGQARITTMDNEVLDAIRAEGWPVRFSSNNGSKASTYSINTGDRSKANRDAGLASNLRKIDVLENKHIPEIYMRASFEQRLALLQGLMDTDGTINIGGGCISYTGVNLELVKGVSELLSTFGVKNTVTEFATKTGFAYRVQYFVTRDELPVFKIKRKLDRMRVSDPKKNNARSKTVQFTSAELVPSVPVKCIMVDSHDHQFLFGRSMLPTHNSTIAAGIMLTALLQNWRDEAEFIILSPTKEIADNSFKPMAAAIENDPELSALLKVQSHIRTITHKTTKATIKVVAADSATVSGKKAVGVLIDELHEFGKIANAGKIFTEATGGLMSRPEGFIIYLTTQSSDPPAGVFKEKLDYARKVRDGIIDDPQFYPIIYEFPPEMLADEENKPYLKPENFYMTNPNLGYSVDEAYLVRKIQQAQDVSQKELQDVLAKHLNIQVGIQLADDNWPGAAVWLKTKAQPVSLAYLLAHSEVVTMGVDGGGLDDLFGLCALGRERGGHRLFAWFHAFAHSVVLDRRKEIAPRLLDFEKQGDLTTVEMVGEDAKRIAEYAKQVDDSGLLFGIGFDPNSLGGLLGDLEDAGISEEKCFRVNQGWKLAASIMGTERKLAACDIIHNHSSMMKWCVGNAKVELKGNAKVITKQKSGTAKIDPLMAMFNAMELMLTNPPAQYVDWDFSTMELIG